MSNKQQEGQDGISQREELLNLSDDAAIEDMTTPDLLCVMYVTGIRNNELREKLMEISRPAIKKFDQVVDSFDQARKQLEEMRRPTTSAATQPTQRKQQRSETTKYQPSS